MPHRRSTRLFAQGLAIALGLAGCGELPRPFRPVGQAPAPLVDPPTRRGVLVVPVAGMADLFQGDRLATAVAAALETVGVPAARGAAAARARVLAGRATLSSAGSGGAGQVTLVWETARPDGLVLGRWEQRVAVTPARWAEADPQLLGEIAAAGKTALAALVSDQPVAAAPSEKRRVMVLAARGAPGDGDQSLPLAMKTELRRRGIALVQDPAEADAVIDCAVTVAPAAQPGGGSGERVSLTWVVRSPSGAELGRAEQSNVVPEGSLTRWGEAARAVAAAAAPGLIAVVTREAR